MATHVTADPVTRIIQITTTPDVNGEIRLDFERDIYSALKGDWISDESLRKLRFPIVPVGGNPTPDGALDGTFFVASDWKLRPYEGNHRLIVSGNVYSVDGTSPITDTVGMWRIFTEFTVSSTVKQVVSGSGVTAQDVVDISSASAVAVWGVSKASQTDGATMGGWVASKLLTLRQYLSKE